MDIDDLRSRRRSHELVRARELLMVLGVERYGIKVKDLARDLRKSPDGMTQTIARAAPRRIRGSAFLVDLNKLDHYWPRVRSEEVGLITEQRAWHLSSYHNGTTCLAPFFRHLSSYPVEALRALFGCLGATARPGVVASLRRPVEYSWAGLSASERNDGYRSRGSDRS